MRRLAGPGPLGLAVVALALGACGGAGDPAPAGADPLVYGGARPVRLQVPASVEPGKTYPLVLLVHGYGASGTLQQLYFGLGPSTLPGGAFLLAPDGTSDGSSRFWHANDVCCAFGPAQPDDVAYLGGLLDAVAAEWPIDPARVLVLGHSNGAFMAYRLACDRADRVTAIAGLAGAASSIDGSGCAPAKPVSVLHLHGTADQTVAYGGGMLLPGGPAYPGAVASTEQWAAHDGCGTSWTAGAARDLVSTLAGAETATAAAGGCPAGVAVERWTMTGAPHVPALTADFSAQVLGWLAEHPRP
ncbi:MAG: alpha/beta hydrolase-fold protein [Anaeromyxobacteraceae bacterium]